MSLQLKSEELDLDKPVQVEKVHDKEVTKFGTGGHVICNQDDIDKRAIVLVLSEEK